MGGITRQIYLGRETPARFALHKLLIARERGVTAQTKVDKDLLQAAQVLSVLAEEHPGDITRAWDELERQEKGWLQRVRAGLKQIEKRHVAHYAKIRAVVG